jgi:hypothetical protein
MYVIINYNMYTICIRNMARSKSIPLLCTHVGSYKFRKVHPRGNSSICMPFVYTMCDVLSCKKGSLVMVMPF